MRRVFLIPHDYRRLPVLGYVVADAPGMPQGIRVLVPSGGVGDEHLVPEWWHERDGLIVDVDRNERTPTERHGGRS